MNYPGFLNSGMTTISPSELRSMGLECASKYINKVASLNDAVAGVVRERCLNTEQMNRVVEFANHETFRHLMKVAGADRIIEFDIADPKIIATKSSPPSVTAAPAMTKVAHYVRGSEFIPDIATAIFGAYAEDKTKTASVEGPSPDQVRNDYFTLKNLHGQYQADYNSALVGRIESEDRLKTAVRRAVLDEGATLAEVIAAMHASGHGSVKLAQLAVSELVDSGAISRAHFGTPVSDYRVPNPNHPVVTAFRDMCDYSVKVAALKGVSDKVAEDMTRVKTGEYYALKTKTAAELNRPKVEKRTKTAGFGDAMKSMGRKLRIIEEVPYERDLPYKELLNRAKTRLGMNPQQSLPNMPSSHDSKALKEAIEFEKILGKDAGTEHQLTNFGKGAMGLGLGVGGIAAAHGTSNILEKITEKRDREKSWKSIMSNNSDLDSVDPKFLRQSHSVLWKFAPSVASDPLLAGAWLRGASRRTDVGISPEMVQSVANLEKAKADWSVHKGRFGGALRQAPLFTPGTFGF